MFKIPLVELFPADSLLSAEPPDFLRELITWLVIEIGSYDQEWGLVNKSDEEYKITPYIWFKYEEDAVAFKLIWCGH